MGATNSVSKENKESLKRLNKVSGQIRVYESALEQAREVRDSLFLELYDTRQFTVTHMANVAGIRRESVHLAINRAKERSVPFE